MFHFIWRVMEIGFLIYIAGMALCFIIMIGGGILASVFSPVTTPIRAWWRRGHPALPDPKPKPDDELIQFDGQWCWHRGPVSLEILEAISDSSFHHRPVPKPIRKRLRQEIYNPYRHPHWWNAYGRW